MTSEPVFWHERLDVYKLALSFVSRIEELVAEFAASPAVVEHLSRASESTVENIVNGNCSPSVHGHCESSRTEERSGNRPDALEERSQILTWEVTGSRCWEGSSRCCSQCGDIWIRPIRDDAVIDYERDYDESRTTQTLTYPAGDPAVCIMS